MLAKAKGEAKGAHFFFAPLLFLCFSFAFDFPLLLTSQPQRQKATQLLPAAQKQGRQKDFPLLFTSLCFSFAFDFATQRQKGFPLLFTSQPQRQKATQSKKANEKAKDNEKQ